MVLQEHAFTLISQVSSFLLTKVITKRKFIFDMQFPFIPVGVKWKVVKNAHCPPLLIDTGLMSIVGIRDGHFKQK